MNWTCQSGRENGEHLKPPRDSRVASTQQSTSMAPVLFFLSQLFHCCTSYQHQPLDKRHIFPCGLFPPDYQKSPVGSSCNIFKPNLASRAHPLLWHQFYGAAGTGSGEGNGTPLQHSCLENPMDGGSMGSLRVRHDWATSLSLFTFMHWRKKWQPTRALAWRIPGTGEPGGLPSRGSHSGTQLKRLSSSSSRDR